MGTACPGVRQVAEPGQPLWGPIPAGQGSVVPREPRRVLAGGHTWSPWVLLLWVLLQLHAVPRSPRLLCVHVPMSVHMYVSTCPLHGACASGVGGLAVPTVVPAGLAVWLRGAVGTGRTWGWRWQRARRLHRLPPQNLPWGGRR